MTHQTLTRHNFKGLFNQGRWASMQRGRRRIQPELGAPQAMEPPGNTMLGLYSDHVQGVGFGAAFAGLRHAQRPLVVGENMTRVRRYARQVGGTYYRPRNWSMRNNDQMMWRNMRQGRTIINIGRDPALVRRNLPPRPVWEREIYLMEKRGYQYTTVDPGF